MNPIDEILARAAALRDETRLNSITPDRAGGIMYDTLIALNQIWLEQAAGLIISKIYPSVEAMEEDPAPVSDLTGLPLRPGQIVVIASGDADNGMIYRFNGENDPRWEEVGEMGSTMPVDNLTSESSVLPLAAHQGKVLKGLIDGLDEDKVEKEEGKGLSSNDYTDQEKEKLGALPTGAQLNEELGQKASKDADAVNGNLASFDGNGNPVDSGIAASDVPFLNRALGKYDAISETVLSQAKAGKYVDVNGAEVSAAGYGISAPIQLNFGDILLVPSASAVPAAVSVISRVVTRTYDKVINYAYTYRQDYPELYDTATADYDPTLVYTAVYDTSGETPVLTGWTIGGQTLEELPATHEVTDSYYGPLFKQAVAAMPSTGYYIYLCPQAMEVVISGYTDTVNGGTCLTVGLGIFKNIVSNFLARPGQDAVAQSLCDLYTLILGLAGRLENLGDVKAGTIDCENLPKVCGAPMVIEGVGAPSVVPHFVGQRYHDTTSGAQHLYEAFAVTGSTGDWVLIK